MLEHSLSDINETSKKYLDKINSSTTRMAKLIRDVLVYSQLANQNEIYKMVDLQQIIELNKTDYELLIEQKKATVSCENLPAVEAIPLQMTQLFGNLLSNSLKYSKPGEKPVIQISSTPLMAKDALNYFDADPQMEYYKIDFKDNGIGFRQEYANRIFNIFQRLHGKTDFSGTGIGLAMCKKIAQNHNGDIFAQGNPGKGAVFTVILPARQNKT